MSNPADHFSGNIDRFSGFADLYNRHRPAPPTILAAVLTRLAAVPFPELVVDLGSGTGLSTRYWADKSNQVIGIEPTADMRRQAAEATLAANVTYQEGFSHQTGLPVGCAAIVTCAQSLHWMEPGSTFQETKRILQAGGVFAAFDYDWPPTTGSWEADQAYSNCMQRAVTLESTYGAARTVRRWDKNSHLSRMQDSGCFRFTKEIVLHHTDLGNAERLVGLALSQGMVMSLLKKGVPESEIGLDQLRLKADQYLGNHQQEWVWSARLRFGIV